MNPEQDRSGQSAGGDSPGSLKRRPGRVTRSVQAALVAAISIAILLCFGYMLLAGLFASGNSGLSPRGRGREPAAPRADAQRGNHLGRRPDSARRLRSRRSPLRTLPRFEGRDRFAADRPRARPERRHRGTPLRPPPARGPFGPPDAGGDRGSRRGPLRRSRGDPVRGDRRPRDPPGGGRPIRARDPRSGRIEPESQSPRPARDERHDPRGRRRAPGGAPQDRAREVADHGARRLGSGGGSGALGIALLEPAARGGVVPNDAASGLRGNAPRRHLILRHAERRGGAGPSLGSLRGGDGRHAHARRKIAPGAGEHLRAPSPGAKRGDHRRRDDPDPRGGPSRRGLSRSEPGAHSVVEVAGADAAGTLDGRGPDRGAPREAAPRCDVRGDARSEPLRTAPHSARVRPHSKAAGRLRRRR